MDNVNKPAHYTAGRFEVIEVIEDWKLNFRLGNTVKYIARAGKKDPTKILEDLEKARWYLDREITKLKGETNAQIIKEPINDFPTLKPIFPSNGLDYPQGYSPLYGPIKYGKNVVCDDYRGTKLSIPNRKPNKKR